MADTKADPAAYSPADAARQLTIARSTLYSMINRGEIRFVKIGHRTLIPATEIDRVLAPAAGDAA